MFSDAQSLLDKTLLEPVAGPLAPPEEEQRLDFSGDVNAILEDKMLWVSKVISVEMALEAVWGLALSYGDLSIFQSSQLCLEMPKVRDLMALVL